MTSKSNLETQALEAEIHISQACSRDDAVRLSIKAIEFYMGALKAAVNDEDKSRLRHKCQGLLKSTEALKKDKSIWVPAVSSSPRRPNVPDLNLPSSGPLKPAVPPQVLKAPVSSRPFTTKEQVILLEGSKLNGFVFPPWVSDPDPSEFHLANREEYFLDSLELGLSSRQLRVFDGWKRPCELFPPLNEAAGEGPAMSGTTKIDLVQDATTDCSVVASLCALAARAERGHAKLLRSVIYPYDHKEQIPLISRNGKYVFKLYFNGSFRKVVIDDRLPSSRTSRLLHVVDRNNPRLLWPALLEKAYLKVRGGYDFPGSNSGTDLGLLTGWIPEQVFLQSDEVIPNQLWQRIYKSFSYGDVMVTLGTGRLSNREETELGLAGEHDYAVLDMKVIGNRRLLLVKNPWSEGTIWKGSAPDTGLPDVSEEDETDMSWTESVRQALPGSNKLSPGTFWIDLNNVMQHFESIYLNWNPGLFSQRQDFHFRWDLASACPSSGCFGRNPQYSVHSSSGGVVWVLLSKHFQSAQDKAGAYENKPANMKSETGFISLYVFAHQGHRVFLSDGALYRGPYVDSPQTLLRLDLPPNTTRTIAASQQYLPQSTQSFTLSFFSRNSIKVLPAADPYPHITALHSAWTASTAGGNAASPSYPLNPQFALHLPTVSSLYLLLETASTDLSIHVKLVWASGHRVASLTTRDIVAESGEYRRGCAFVEIPNVAAGSYTIVCSTFEPMQLGPFTLRVGTDVPGSRVVPIPSERAGKLSTVLPPASFGGSDGGGSRILASLRAPFLTRVKIIAGYPRTVGGARPPLKASLELAQGPEKRVLAVSSGGEFSDAPMGVRTEEVDVEPAMDGMGGVWIVLERLGEAAREEAVQVELLSEGRLWVGDWGVGVD